MAKGIKDFVAEARARIREISADELRERREQNEDFLLVDVREAAEYERRHLPGAVLIPRGTIEGAADPTYRHRVDVLCGARDRSVVLYCQTGGRSALATDTLIQMGFQDVTSLAGGIDLWLSEGYETVRGAA
ncbi:MAG: rhodanese-like domain-containing protein [Acidiferrobacteraceae bacterium]